MTLTFRAYIWLAAPASIAELRDRYGLPYRRLETAVRCLRRAGAVRLVERRGRHLIYVAVPGASVLPDGRGAHPRSRANLRLGPLRSRRKGWRIADERGYGHGRVAIEEAWRR